MATRDPRISEIFYYLESLTDTGSGRTMGRKIGVVQEIICRKLLMQSQKLADAVIFEPYLMGASTADHKVEFVFFQPTLALDFSLTEGDTIGPFTRLTRVSHKVDDVTITLLRVRGESAQFKVEHAGNKYKFTLWLHEHMKAEGPLELIGTKGGSVKLSAVTADSARLVFVDRDDVRASVESKRVGAQRFSGSDKLGSGIQTIEKAKQASLVAIDADLYFNKTIKALAQPGERRYISIVVLGNGVHWTDKDRAILKTYVDFTFLAKDDSIIRYLDYVKAKAVAAGADFKTYLMAYFQGMTKTPPDSFAVTAADFEIIEPAAETRSLNDILDQHIDNYPVR